MTTGFGSGPEHGQSIVSEIPQFGNYQTTDFRPRFVCAVYMRFEQAKNGQAPNEKYGATLRARHAYYPIQNYSMIDAETQGKRLLEAIGTNNFSTIRPVRYSDNFWRFGFNSQQVIVLFVDNDPDIVGFDPNAHQSQIVRFCAYSGQDEQKPRRMNYAFTTLTPLDFTQIDPGSSWTRDCNVGYRLNFWNTDDNGRTITGTVANDPYTHYLYAMNIHLRMLATALATPQPQPPAIPGPEVPPPVQPRHFIPIIVDPDTGNMGGTP